MDLQYVPPAQDEYAYIHVEPNATSSKRTSSLALRKNQSKMMSLKWNAKYKTYALIHIDHMVQSWLSWPFRWLQRLHQTSQHLPEHQKRKGIRPPSLRQTLKVLWFHTNIISTLSLKKLNNSNAFITPVHSNNLFLIIFRNNKSKINQRIWVNVKQNMKYIWLGNWSKLVHYNLGIIFFMSLLVFISYLVCISDILIVDEYWLIHDCYILMCFRSQPK